MEKGERKECLPTDLFPYDRINELLSQSPISLELSETRFKATNARSFSMRKGFFQGPPRFCSVSEFHSAVYDINKKMIFEGGWDEPHPEIAMRNNLTVLERQGSRMPRYSHSCEVFSLKALPQIKVLILDTLYNFRKEDLIASKQRGYMIMGPDYQWLMEDSDNPLGFTEIPSPMSKVTPLIS